MPWFRARSESAARWIAWQCLARRYGIVTINEFPKSGGTWVAQLLSAALRIPFVSHRFPRAVPSILHGHYLRQLATPGDRVTVFRDGRDVMVSWYHHCLFPQERLNLELVGTVRRLLEIRDPHNVRRNLPRFIEYAFTRPAYPRFTWAEFIDRWAGEDGLATVRYEDLKTDASTELRRLALRLGGIEIPHDEALSIVKRFSFKTQSGRDAGIEDKTRFLRKGIVGDWKNHFTPQAREVFNHHAGRQLRSLGYESDDLWVTRETAAG